MLLEVYEGDVAEVKESFEGALDSLHLWLELIE